jgi:hypothetical protein
MRHQIRVGLKKQIGKALLVAGDSDYVMATNAAKKTVNVTLCYYEGTIHRRPLNVSDERVQKDAAPCVIILESNRNQCAKLSVGNT